MAVTPKSTTVQVEGGANEPSSPPGLPTSSQRKRVASQIASSGRPAIPGPFSPVFYADIGSATAPRNLPLSPPFLVESLRVTGLKERWKLVKWIASDLGCAGVSVKRHRNPRFGGAAYGMLCSCVLGTAFEAGSESLSTSSHLHEKSQTWTRKHFFYSDAVYQSTSPQPNALLQVIWTVPQRRRHRTC
ncbi:uncharacterized protein P884DRAFT_295026 [Thermothelomyces heterothallicus CBS 202.75]|uniref:uncharacterized protein n=1 Tax=Thermothelomyces heterothallicus CBS 202.75 TaxID=1149848 RepID=UPI003744639E